MNPLTAIQSIPLVVEGSTKCIRVKNTDILKIIPSSCKSQYTASTVSNHSREKRNEKIGILSNSKAKVKTIHCAQIQISFLTFVCRHSVIQVI